MRPVRLTFLFIALIAAWGQQSKKSEKTDAEIRQEIIKESIASYRGNCPCPYNVDRAGRRCGARSAYSRPGGASPICYDNDVTQKMVDAPAKADLFTLNIDHCSGGCGTSPFGTIDIEQNGANSVQMVISLNNGNEFVHTGQPGSTVGFDLVGNPTITLGSSTLPGWSLDSSTAGSLMFDGFGDFEYSLNCCFSTLRGRGIPYVGCQRVVAGERSAAHLPCRNALHVTHARF